MSYCTVPYRTVPCCAAPHRAVPHCAVPHRSHSLTNTLCTCFLIVSTPHPGLLNAFAHKSQICNTANGVEPNWIEHLEPKWVELLEPKWVIEPKWVEHLEPTLVELENMKNRKCEKTQPNLKTKHKTMETMKTLETHESWIVGAKTTNGSPLRSGSVAWAVRLCNLSM